MRLIGREQSNWSGPIAWGIFLVGLMLRMVSLDAHGLWIDEVASLDAASLGFPVFVTGRFGHLLNQTPLHYSIVWLTSLLADPATTTIFVRLPSALAGALSVPLLYLLGKELFGRAQGLLAAGLLALAATALNYSQDLRPYSMMLMLTVLAVYCLLKAGRIGTWQWWFGFAASAIANASNAYFGLTLATPPLLALLAWALWVRWKARSDEPRAWTLAWVATAILFVGLAANALDLLSTSRVPPDWGKFSIVGALSSIPELLAFFTQLGFEGSIERLMEGMVLVVALLGVLAAAGHPVRAERRYLGVTACALFIVIPSIILAIFATNGVVFQRYALFAMPFYFLLVGHGIVALYRAGQSAERATYTRLGRATAIAMAIVVFGAFAFGAYAYENPDLHARVGFRQDFRGVARYLTTKVKPSDTVVFLDDTGHGYTVTNFYWKGKSPTTDYDVRDPRLFTHPAGGDIYWVTSLADLHALDLLATPEQGWSEVAAFERVKVLHEAGTKSILDSMDRIVGKLGDLLPGYQPVTTLKGCVQQARGDLEGAAKTYREAGAYFPVGLDYLRTAEGYEKLGYEAWAWREALLSKYLEPFRPEVHEWLAHKLSQSGFAEQSRAEETLAQSLKR